MRIMLAAIAMLSAALPASAADFNYRLMLTDEAHLNKYFDYESSVDDFMKCFRGPLWTRVQMTSSSCRPSGRKPWSR